jgi:hypothetical protein
MEEERHILSLIFCETFAYLSAKKRCFSRYLSMLTLLLLTNPVDFHSREKLLNAFFSKCGCSLLFFGQDTYNSGSNHLKWVLKHLELVRVLNFEQVNLYSIPKKIEKLVFLRYSRIKSLELKVIPPSICNLTNLETLDIRGTFLNCLLKGIWKMRRLRNLYVSELVSLPNHSDPKVTVVGNLSSPLHCITKPKNCLAHLLR